MNIFYIDENPELAARYHGDKHVVKMVLETAQLLSTAHHVLDGDENHFCQKASDGGLYRPSHVNHPSSTWVRQLADNYLWTWELLVFLCFEFEFRRQGKKHKTSQLIQPLQQLPQNIETANSSAGNHQHTTVPPLVMPEEFHKSDPVESYRDYYFFKWQEGVVSYEWGREMPEWLQERISLPERAEIS